MIDASAINNIVRSSVDEVVEAAFLLSSEGEIIASGYKCEGSGPEKHDLSASIVAMAWKCYGKCDLSLNIHGQEEEDSLEQFFLEFQNKKICAMSVVKNYLVLLVGVGEAETGLLKLKTASLQRGVNFLLTQELNDV